MVNTFMLFVDVPAYVICFGHSTKVEIASVCENEGTLFYQKIFGKIRRIIQWSESLAYDFIIHHEYTDFMYLSYFLNRFVLRQDLAQTDFELLNSSDPSVG